MRGDRQGSLALLDALLFVGIVSVVAALLLADVPQHAADSRGDAERYARSVLHATLAATVENPMILLDGELVLLDRGPLAGVLVDAFERPGRIGMLPFLRPVLRILEPLVREDWGYWFTAKATHRRGPDAALNILGTRPFGAENDVFTAIADFPLAGRPGASLHIALHLAART